MRGPITHFAMKTNRGKELDLVLHHAKARGIALDVDMADADGRPALALMARGNARATAVLLRHGSNVHRFWTERTGGSEGTPAISDAISAGGAAVKRTLPQHLQLLLHHGLDANCPATGAAGTPLLVQAFVTRKECLDRGDGQGRMQASACIDLLLAAGADPYQCSADAEDARMVAARIGSVAQLRKVLLAAGMPAAVTASSAGVAAPTSASAVAGAGTAGAAASEFVRRLCEPIPATATFRRPTGSV